MSITKAVFVSGGLLAGLGVGLFFWRWWERQQAKKPPSPGADPEDLRDLGVL